MASIRRRGNSFQIRVSVGYDSNMNQIVETTTFRPSLYTEKGYLKSDNVLQKEAENYARILEEEIQTGGKITGDKINFETFYNEWKKKYAAQNLQPTTIDGYDQLVYQKVVNEIGHLKMSNIYPIVIQNLYVTLENSGAKFPTLKKIHHILSGIFKVAVAWRVIKENPCDNVFAPKESKEAKVHSDKYWTLEQAQTFLELIKTPLPITYKSKHRKSKTGAFYDVKGYTEYRKLDLQFIVMFEILLFCGIRRGELIALEWNDFHLKGKYLDINKSTAFLKGKMIDKSTKTNTTDQMQPLPDFLVADLIELKKQQQEYMLNIGDQWKGKRDNSQKIFIQQNGMQMYLSTPYHKFKNVIEMCNNAINNDADKLPNIPLHGLRHTYATLLISEADIDIKTASSLLGHKQTSTTMNIYSHSVHKKKIEAVENLNDLINRKL